MKVAVVGGGIAGLAVAWRLRSHHDVVVFDTLGRVGGYVTSMRIGGYVFDSGPNGFSSSVTELAQLVDESGLRERAVPAQAAAKRYIFWKGRLHLIPLKPAQAITTQLISPMGKLTALRDLFARANESAEASNETVDQFFTRHFGAEVARRIVATALLGINGGDSKRTSVAALFPRLLELERTHGSILRAAVRGQRSSGTLTSFPNGMGELTGALAAGLGSIVRGIRAGNVDAVRAIAREGSGWRVRTGDGSEERFDTVILATPAYVAAGMLASTDPELEALLQGIEYASMRVAGIAFKTADVSTPLDGFGFLAARGEGVRILGALYTSALFPDQAPDGMTYLRAFLGGAFDPQAMEYSSEATQAIVLADLRRVLGIDAPVRWWTEVSWLRAIPQYGAGHVERVRAIENRANALGNLWLIGSAYRGVGVADVVRDALAVAGRLTG